MNNEWSETGLQNLLREDERVLWSSGTGRFPLLARDAELRILGKWTGTCLVTLGVLWLYLGSGGSNRGVIGAVLLIAAALVLSPVAEYRSLLRQRYWITNQRAILMSAKGTFYYLELADMPEFRVVHSRGGMDCLVLGEAVSGNTEGRMRWRACHPELGDENGGEEVKAAGMIFFAVESVKVAAALLPQGRAVA